MYFVDSHNNFILLNLIFKTAKRYSMIENNPCQDAQKPKRKDEDEGLKFFTPKQALMFMKSLNMSYEVTYKGHQRVDDTGKPYYVNEYTESYMVGVSLATYREEKQPAV